jgi:hypothetical protein
LVNLIEIGITMAAPNVSLHTVTAANPLGVETRDKGHNGAAAAIVLASHTYSCVDGRATLVRLPSRDDVAAVTAVLRRAAVLNPYDPAGVRLPYGSEVVRLPSVAPSTGSPWAGDRPAASHATSITVDAGTPHVLIADTPTATVIAVRTFSAPVAHDSAAVEAAATVLAPLKTVPTQNHDAEEKRDDETYFALRAEQRQYVRGVRDMLRINLQRDSTAYMRAAKSLDLLPASESSHRSKVEVDAVSATETVCRHVIEELQQLHQREIQRGRQTARLVPWCTDSCGRCCMATQDWAAHVRVVGEQLASFFELCEVRARETIVAAEAELRRTVARVVFTVDSAHRRIENEDRALLERTEVVARRDAESALNAVWVRDVELAWLEVQLKARAHADKMALRERSVEVYRVEDTLDLRERRARRKDIQLLVEQEVTGRRGIIALEEVVQQQILNKFTEYFSAEQVARCTVEIADLTAQRDELLDFQRERLAEDEHEAQDAARRDQRELEEEYVEVKRLKKLKGNIPLPVCTKCQATMQNPHQHRIEECPARPVQCTKCELVLRTDKFDEHKEQCPARVVQCVPCGNWYQARYLEGQHRDICLNAKEARRMLTDVLRPQWPFRVVSETIPAEVAEAAQGKGVLIRLDANAGDGSPTNANASPKGFGSSAGLPRLSSSLAQPQFEYVLKQIDDMPVDSASKLVELLPTMSVGERCKVVLIPTPALQTTASSFFASVSRSRPPSATAAAAAASPGADAPPALSLGGTSPRETPMQESLTPADSSLNPQLQPQTSIATPARAAAVIPGVPFTKDITIATSIPISEFKGLALLAAEDDQYTCKPPTAGGKKPAPKK